MPKDVDIENDESGTLRRGYFYRVEGIPMGEPEDWYSGWLDPKNLILRAPKLKGQRSYSWFSIADVDGDGSANQCGRHPFCRNSYTSRVRSGTLNGGKQLPLLMANDNDCFIISPQFLAKLTETPLRGYKTHRIEIDVNQTGAPAPELLHVAFEGKGDLRGSRLRDGVANAGPHCGAGPVVCDNCGSRNVKCPKCQQFTLILWSAHDGESDASLRLAEAPADGLILDGATWDGSDFVAARSILTQRAVDWLKSINASPLILAPVQVRIDGMSQQQLAWLEEAKGVPVNKNAE